MRTERWPLVGRAEELRLVGGVAVRDGRPGGVLVAGAAGVGKTRLAREALAAAERSGAVVHWASGSASARGLPLGAFAAALGLLGSEPIWLLQRARAALSVGAGRGGVLVGVDDAHLLDDLSASLVHQVVMRREAAVVLTVRTGEPAPDAITDLWKDGHLRRLELRPLPADATGALLEEALGGPVAAAACRRLWTITRGNPLYLRQLVEGEVEEGRLVRVAGVWQWSGRPRLSPGLSELVAARIGRLSDAQRDVVDVLAFGEPLGVAVLADLTGAEAMEQAEAHGLIEVYADGRRWQARLGHPLFGELQRARCGRMRARRLRGRIATALAATSGRRADDALRRATLLLDSDLEPDADLFTGAARRAAELCDPALSERLARAAVAAGGGIPARFALCEALLGLPPLDTVHAELTTLAALVRNDLDRTRVATHQAVTLFWVLARPADAEAVLGLALDRVADTGCRQVLVGLQSVLHGVLCRPADAVAAANAVLGGPASANPIAVTYACWGLALALGGLGRLDGLAEAVGREEAATSGRFEGAHYRVAGVGNAWTRALRLAGRLADAERVARGYVERYQDATGRSGPISAVVHGLVLLDQGYVHTAARLFRTAGAGLRNQHPVWSFVAAVGLATAWGMAGDATAARQALAEADGQRHPSLVFREPDRLLARAWVAAAEGAVGEARTVAREAGALAAEQSQPAVEVLALHHAVCFGDRGVAARLAELAGAVDGPRAPAAAAHAAALAAGDGDALQAASTTVEDMGALLLAADAAAHAATAHTRRGRRGSAQTARVRAHRLAEACGGARTPALAVLAAPPTLTGREREIVTLAAGGLSNRAIAERLVLSVRTVENHLYRACTKLGTTDRDELAALLRG